MRWVLIGFGMTGHRVNPVKGLFLGGLVRLLSVQGSYSVGLRAYAGSRD